MFDRAGQFGGQVARDYAMNERRPGPVGAGQEDRRDPFEISDDLPGRDKAGGDNETGEPPQGRLHCASPTSAARPNSRRWARTSRMLSAKPTMPIHRR